MELHFSDFSRAFLGMLSFAGVLSMFFLAMVGMSYNMNRENIVYSASPSMISDPGGGGGGGGSCAISSASMGFEITNITPWDSFFYLVNSREVAYFNVTDHFTCKAEVCTPQISFYAKVSGSIGGQVLNKNGPYSFANGTTSNGIQFTIFSADVEMVNWAIVYGAKGLHNNMYTNILVDYKVMGNGDIYIKYWVSYNSVLDSDVAGWMALGNLAKIFSQSGGG